MLLPVSWCRVVVLDAALLIIHKTQKLIKCQFPYKYIPEKSIVSVCNDIINLNSYFYLLLMKTTLYKCNNEILNNLFDTYYTYALLMVSKKYFWCLKISVASGHKQHSLYVSE